MLSSKEIVDLSNYLNLIPSEDDISDLIDQGFICTDEDSNQFVKKISNTYFKVLDQGRLLDINLLDYSELELREYIVGYYSSLEDLRKIYGEDSNQIIVECIAEQM